MVIFHSYVKLPEGNHIQFVNLSHSENAEKIQTYDRLGESLRDFDRGMHHLTNIANYGKIHHVIAG